MNLSIIKALLTDKGLSMTALAEKSGMSRRGFYSAIDNNTITAETLEKVANYLNVPIWEFFEESAPVVNRNKIEEFKNEIQLLQDHIYDKIKLERLFAKSLFNVQLSYYELLDTLSDEEKKKLDNNRAYLRFHTMLLEAINEITFNSDMQSLEYKKDQKK